MARVIFFMYAKVYDEKYLPAFYAHLYLDEEEREDAEGNGHSNESLKEIDNLGLRKRLKVNALVYKTAEMLGVEDLQREASARFMDAAETAFDMDGFEEVADLVYNNTRVDDRDIRFRLTQLCVENYDLLEIRSKTVAVIEHHQPNVWNVTVELMKRWASDVSPQNTLVMSFRRRLEKAVGECNRKRAVGGCQHIGYTNAARLKVEDDGSLTIPCPHC